MEAAELHPTMATRNSGLLLVRQLLANRSNLCASLLPHHSNLPTYSIRTLSSFSNPQSSSPNPTPPPNPKPFSNFPSFRSFSSSPAGLPNVVTVKSEADLNSALSKAEGGSLPAIFYFTAVWCGPCRFIAPVIGELSEKYPHVTTFKVDIDEESLGSALGKLNISSVPTFHFFQNGKKAAEFAGADATRLKDTFAKLYKNPVQREIIECDGGVYTVSNPDGIISGDSCSVAKAGLVNEERSKNKASLSGVAMNHCLRS